MIAPIDVRNPRTGEVDYRIQPPTPDELAETVAGMRTAQRDWWELGVSGRAAILRAWVQSVAANPAPLLDALAQDTGRLRIARTELFALPGMVDSWAGAAARLLDEGSERDSVNPGFGIRDQFVPHAVVGIISPWNFPLLLSMVDSIPALMAGCAVLIKPSEVTPRFAAPLTASIAAYPELAKIFKLVNGDGRTGALVIDHVDAIAFTGSVKTGRIVAEACAKRFIPVFLELGGKDPCVVLPSADVEAAARVALRASIQATGQACQSLERIYVPADMAEAFVANLVEKAEAVELNYPDIAEGHIGPLIFARQAEIIQEHLQDAVAKGARILTGGEIETHGGGAWIRPTVIVDVDHSMKVMREETFGPVMPVMTYKTIDEAVRLANDTDYGLSAAVIGSDPTECEAVARQLNAGAVGINDGAVTAEVPDAAHDAFGYSGLGACRSGDSGLMRYLRRKALVRQRGEARGADSLNERLAAAG
ncbi:MAG: aldehyde dehydrogenase family protein [Gammaproteobacteria bacterium]|nr:aldehyde dehydrogenase family protein [Gammaproteobacteria bacterium]